MSTIVPSTHYLPLKFNFASPFILSSYLYLKYIFNILRPTAQNNANGQRLTPLPSLWKFPNRTSSLSIIEITNFKTWQFYSASLPQTQATFCPQKTCSPYSGNLAVSVQMPAVLADASQTLHLSDHTISSPAHQTAQKKYCCRCRF